MIQTNEQKERNKEKAQETCTDVESHTFPHRILIKTQNKPYYISKDL